MRFSMLVASHNEGDLLAKRLFSCMEDCRGLRCEIVVVDDGSTDGCTERIERELSGIRLIKQPNRRGPSHGSAGWLSSSYRCGYATRGCVASRLRRVVNDASA